VGGEVDITRPAGDVTKANPNAGHYALVDLEKLGIIRCVITQNVDGLHEKAGTRRLLEYHGSLIKLRCVSAAPGSDKSSSTLTRCSRRINCHPVALRAAA